MEKYKFAQLKLTSDPIFGMQEDLQTQRSSPILDMSHSLLLTYGIRKIVTLTACDPGTLLPSSSDLPW